MPTKITRRSQDILTIETAFADGERVEARTTDDGRAGLTVVGDRTTAAVILTREEAGALAMWLMHHFRPAGDDQR